MYTTTDMVMGFLFLVYALDGLQKGLFRSLISPLSFGICLIVGVLHFDLNQNFVKALEIIVLGTFFLSTGIKLLLFFTRRTVDEKYRDHIFWGSRIIGAGINIFWKGGVTIIVLLLLASLPAVNPGMQSLQNNIRSSKAYDLINQKIATTQTPLHKLLATAEVLKDPSRHEDLAETPELKDFSNNPKAMAMIKDPDVMAAVENNDFLQLLANPNVTAVLNDDHLMSQLAELGKRIYVETNTALPDTESSP